MKQSEAFRMRAQSLDGIGRKAGSDLVALIQRRRKELEEVANRSEIRHLPEQAKAEAIEELRGPIREKAREEFQSIVESVTSAKAELEKLVAEGLRQGSDEIPDARIERRWRRIERQLERRKDSSEVLVILQGIIGEAIAEGDQAAMHAIREELPSYLDSKGIDPSSVEVELQRMDIIGDPEGRGLTRAIGHLGGKGWYRVEQSLQMARRELEGTGTADFLVGYDGDTLPVTEGVWVQTTPGPSGSTETVGIEASSEDTPNFDAPLLGHRRVTEDAG